MATTPEVTRALAKSKYASKVCGYLGVDKSKCEKVFDKLFANMKAAYEAVT
jgi:roadblock/LC7 domain-containing protein